MASIPMAAHLEKRAIEPPGYFNFARKLYLLPVYLEGKLTPILRFPVVIGRISCLPGGGAYGIP